MIIFGTKYYFDKNVELHRDGDKPALKTLYGTKHYYKHGKYHRDGDKPAVICLSGTKEYYKDGIEYTKEKIEKIEKIRTRIVNKIALSCARYWYDKTYEKLDNFRARMKRDMKKLEEEIGYKLV